MPYLWTGNRKPEVLLALVCGQTEQRPGSQATARRQLLCVPSSDSGQTQILPPTQAQQAAGSDSTDRRHRRRIGPLGLSARAPEARRSASIPPGVSVSVFALRL